MTKSQASVPGQANVMVVCTANICRSAMAGALLARQLDARGVVASVRSAGMLREGDPSPSEVISAMAVYGIDAGSHRSRVVGAGDLAAADLVLAMARDHLRRAVVALPEAWPRAFTLRELVRRGERIGPRGPGEKLAGWLARAHADRERWRLLGQSDEDDVADPTGGPPQAYADTAKLLDRLTRRLAELAWGQSGREPAADPPGG